MHLPKISFVRARTRAYCQGNDRTNEWTKHLRISSTHEQNFSTKFLIISSEGKPAAHKVRCTRLLGLMENIRNLFERKIVLFQKQFFLFSLAFFFFTIYSDKCCTWHSCFIDTFRSWCEFLLCFFSICSHSLSSGFFSPNLIIARSQTTTNWILNNCYWTF